jgi:F420-dependent oxidoreductase-like protein
MIRIGLQIPNFTFPGVGTEALFDKVASIAVTAENAGFDTVMVMDHFFQLPMLGPPEHEMLEAYTLLAGIAARTSRVMLGTLVTGVTYRHPSLLAKEVTALDVISSGRAFLGIGAAWFEVEHRALGFDFPPVKERMDRLEEAIIINRAMFRDDRVSYSGRYYQLQEAFNRPRPVRAGGPPIMVGGGGERRTLRLAAQYADLWNFPGALDDVPRKLDALARHCDEVGRDISTINKTMLNSLILGRTMEEAIDKRNNLFRARGVDPDKLPPEQFEALAARVTAGDPDAIGERCEAILAAGMDGLTFNLPADAHDLENVAFAGEVLSAVMASHQR